MLLGAPLMAALARRWPARTSLLTFVVLFAAALADAGFLAVALGTATRLVAPDRQGRALAVLLAGTSVATVAGVPGGAVLGTALGWRATFWTIALLCVPAAVGVAAVKPARADSSGPALRSELAQLARPALRRVLLLGVLVNAATFATYPFLAPIVTGTAGLGPLWVPVTLVLFGTGSFAGVTLAGRLSDRHPGLVLRVGTPVLLVGWVVLALLAARPAALLLLVFVQGALSFAWEAR